MAFDRAADGMRQEAQGLQPKAAVGGFQKCFSFMLWSLSGGCSRRWNRRLSPRQSPLSLTEQGSGRREEKGVECHCAKVGSLGEGGITEASPINFVFPIIDICIQIFHSTKSEIKNEFS